MGKFHASKLAAIPEIKFVGCSDLDITRAKAIAGQYNCAAFASPADLLNDIEAVIIAVPTQYHLESALPFLEKGIAVLLEKPIAPDIEAAEKLVHAAETSQAVFQIGHSERFNPVFRAARNRIRNPRFIETHRLAPFKGRGHDVAVILDLMIHDIDLLLDLTGAEPSAIEAAGVGVITETADIVNARLTFPDGCIANITSSRISVKEMRKLRVFQQSGYTSMDLAKGELESYSLVDPESPLAKQAGVFSKFSLPDGRVIVRENSEIPREDNLQNEILSFIEAIKGQHPPLVSGQAGLAALRVAKKIEQLCASYQNSL
jgi:predicted dehydrogenase